MMELTPGYRDSSTPAVAHGDVVATTYTIREAVSYTHLTLPTN